MSLVSPWREAMQSNLWRTGGRSWCRGTECCLQTCSFLMACSSCVPIEPWTTSSAGSQPQWAGPLPKKSLIQKMAYGLAFLQPDLMQAIFHLGSLLSDDFSVYQAAIKTARITTQKCSHSPSFNQRKTIPAS